MNHIPPTSPPSLAATPPHHHHRFAAAYPPRPRPASTSNSSSATSHTQSTAPAVIPLDYNYQTMSPSSLSQFRSDRSSTAATTANTSTANPYHLHSHLRQSQSSADRPSAGDDTRSSVDVELDNQYSSLFGDPVLPPPPSDFLTSSPFDPVSLFRASPLEISSGSDEGGIVGRPGQTRLFSNVPFRSVFSRRTSDASSQPQRHFDVLPTPMPRLQPPDIQILPNSSGGSSSETRMSPNYALLTPNATARRASTAYDKAEPTDVSEIIESLEIRDLQGVRDYSEAKRRVSSFSEDLKSNVDSLSKTQEAIADDIRVSEAARPLPHQYSNDSYASEEWFRPAQQHYPEFSRIPRLRPSSKNIMSIKRDEMPMHHSPVAAMINDSNESNSGGEERLAGGLNNLDDDAASMPPARPPDPSPSLLREIENDLRLLPTHDYVQQEQNERSMESIDQQSFPTPPPPAAPPPPEFSTSAAVEGQSAIKREISPVILRDSIATGGDFRVDQTRLHKKTSFTIIADKSPHSSRAQSPSSHMAHQKRSPSKISGPAISSTAKPVAKPRQYLQRRSLSTTQLKLPRLQQESPTADDSPRPSVQFNMTGRHTPNMMTQRGILQHRESLSSSQDMAAPQSPSVALMSRSRLRRPSTLPTLAKQADKPKMKSYEALPFITTPYRTAIPRFNRSATDLHREPAVFPPGALPRPIKPNPNPTRKQKGLLRILNGDTSHIPLRSNWGSMDDLTLGRHLRPSRLAPIGGLSNRRRSSSTSPERRSSTQTASDRRSSNLSSVTTSDFSFRRPSTVAQPTRKPAIPAASPNMKRRQSLAPIPGLSGGRVSRAKIAKPTTLSPILGTPNKDSSTPQSPAQNGVGSIALSETASDAPSRRDSLSKIPVRATHSRPGSRSSSPLKEFTNKLPLFDPSSRVTSSRTASRTTTRTDHTQTASCTNSRPGSRSTSRASTQPMSRAASRSSTRPNSRMEMAKEMANSRSNSRMSTRSTTSIAGKTSGSPQPMQRRETISVSPVLDRKSRARRQSLSPPNKKRGGSRGRGKKPRDRSESRHSSQSRIPLRSGSLTKVKRSSSKPSAVKGSRSRSPASKSKDAKGQARTSPTRTPGSQRKKEISAKNAKNSVQKPESSVKRTSSSVSKPAAAAQKQPSNLQTSGGTNLRREASNLQKKDFPMTDGTSKAARKQGAAAAKNAKNEGTRSSAEAVALAAGGLKRQATTKSLRKATTKTPKPTAKVKSDGKTVDAGKQTGKKDVNSMVGGTGPAADNKDMGQEAAGNSVVGAEVTKAAATPSAVATGFEATPTRAARAAANISSGSTASSSSTTALKRNASNASLKRMASRMSLLSMKRSDSNLSSRKSKVPAVAEEMSGVIGANGKPAPLKKTNSRAQLQSSEEAMTVTNATIKEDLTDLKTLEADMGLFSDGAGSPTSSVATVVENKVGGGGGNKAVPTAGVGGESVSRTGTSEGATGAPRKSPFPPTQPVEADVSVLNVQCNRATVAAAAAAAATTAGTMALPHPTGVAEEEGATIERNYAYDGDGAADKMTAPAADGMVSGGGGAHAGPNASGKNGPKTIGGSDDIRRRSPDGQGGSAAASGNGSREFLKAADEDYYDDSTPPAGGCCRCCAKFCLPCRRFRCTRCCRRKGSNNKKERSGDEESEEPVLSVNSTASTTNLEVIDEVPANRKSEKTSCWQKLNCCRGCRKKPKDGAAEEHTKITATAEAAAAAANAMPSTPTKQQGICGLCMSKLFCCRRVNKVDPTTGDETELKKCCYCIPCRRGKKSAAGHGATVGSTASRAGSVAWQDLETGGIAATDASVLEGTNSPLEMQPTQGCCGRFWGKLLCCRRKNVLRPSESRRASIRAPPPPSEDTRRRLHVDLVEYNSKMKGAIPVLPLSLAWFCAICNTVCPGLGTLFSGIFCLCVGIPRFSQYDSAKARFGSFIINIIVAVAQMFCVLFCFVGWGWSIWWGTIMLKCARKLSKIKKIERLEMEEERRQAAAVATAARTAANATTESTT